MSKVLPIALAALTLLSGCGSWRPGVTIRGYAATTVPVAPAAAAAEAG